MILVEDSKSQPLLIYPQSQKRDTNDLRGDRTAPFALFIIICCLERTISFFPQSLNRSTHHVSDTVSDGNDSGERRSG